MKFKFVICNKERGKLSDNDLTLLVKEMKKIWKLGWLISKVKYQEKLISIQQLTHQKEINFLYRPNENKFIIKNYMDQLIESGH